MKRSEVVEILSAYLNDKAGMSAECCDEHAAGVLLELEKAGIQPPEWTEQLEDGYDDMFDTVVKVSRHRKDWEPEDESNS